jgi:hypothetical protein
MREYWYERRLVLEYFRLRVVDPDGRPNFHGMGVADKQQKPRQKVPRRQLPSGLLHRLLQSTVESCNYLWGKATK